MDLRLVASFLCLGLCTAMLPGPTPGALTAGSALPSTGIASYGPQKGLLGAVSRQFAGRKAGMRRPNFMRNAMLTTALGGEAKELAYMNAASVFGRQAAMDRMLKLANFPSYRILPTLAGNPSLQKARRYITTIGTMDRLGNDAGQRMYALRNMMSPTTDPAVRKMVLLDAINGKFGDKIERMALMRTMGRIARSGNPASSLAVHSLLN